MPLAQRSALPTVPGVSAAIAVLIAVGATFVGFLIDASRGSELTGAFSVLYFLGCIAAVIAVRHRGLFTAMVQPPLILFIAVPLASQYFTEEPRKSLRDILLNVALPLVDRFPTMLATTLLALIIGLVRMFLVSQQRSTLPRRTRSASAAEDEPRRPRPGTRPRRPAKPEADAGPTPPRRRDARSTRREPPAGRETPQPRSAYRDEPVRPKRYDDPPTRDRAPREAPQSEAPGTYRYRYPKPPEDPPATRSTPRAERLVHDYSVRDYAARDHAARDYAAQDYPARDYAAQDYAAPQPRRQASEGRRRADVPAHPSPRVRYRDREE